MWTVCGFKSTDETMVLLRDKFDGCVNSRGGDVNCPPGPCDLTLLDFFLWEYQKENVYADKPAIIHELKDEIIRRIKGI